MAFERDAWPGCSSPAQECRRAARFMPSLVSGEKDCRRDPVHSSESSRRPSESATLRSALYTSSHRWNIPTARTSLEFSFRTVRQNCVERSVSLGRGTAGAAGAISSPAGASLNEVPLTRSMKRPKDLLRSRSAGLCRKRASKRPEGPGEHRRSMRREKFLPTFWASRGESGSAPLAADLAFCVHSPTTSSHSPGAQRLELSSSWWR